jgi:pimeloyl-ACP methyl ester carboxylesterase
MTMPVNAPLAPIACFYVEAGGRLVHGRRCGAGPAVVMLHDSPRSSRLHLPTMQALAHRYTVFALDTPGYGNSDPLDGPQPEIADFAQALGVALDALGLSEAPLYATHTGAKIALELAANGGRMPRLILDGLSMPDRLAPPDFVARYMRPFAPDASGAYLADEWSRIRDMLRWFPWFDTAPSQRIAMQAPDAAWLEDYGIDLFCAGEHYADAYAAAMRYDPAPALARVALPTLVAAKTDDVLHGYLPRAASCGNPHVQTQSLSADRAAWLAWLEDAFAGTNAPAPLPPPTAQQRSYVDLPHGQMHMTRHGPQTGLPWLILSAPTTLHAQAWAAALADHLPTLVPELPGFGDSAPLAQADAATLCDALAQALDSLGIAQVGVLGHGLAAPLAATLAQRHPTRVAALAVDGMPPLDETQAARFGADLCPAIAFDPHAGTHLHRIWHMLRDGETQWPWHDPSLHAMRRLPPLLDARALHAALTGVLKQPRHWADATKSALAASTTALWHGLAQPVLVFAHTDPAYAQAGQVADTCHTTPVPRPDDLAQAAAAIASFNASLTVPA